MRLLNTLHVALAQSLSHLPPLAQPAFVHALRGAFCTAHTALPHLRPHTAPRSPEHLTTHLASIAKIALQHPSPLDACVAAVSYTFPWADCIARFKFQADPSLARTLAHLMRHAPVD